ncbi:hypothetical protein LSM04_003636 [Trypanosoma melophagium]|uniref:uncharacterized protein n=1 Tax=Trypanosoma melophagium TaxID=715481 RepID=UPI00351A090A|nr:hypothetical protein LSM04_003636 [Trypanosoma melophagium]
MQGGDGEDQKEKSKVKYESKEEYKDIYNVKYVEDKDNGGSKAQISCFSPYPSSVFSSSTQINETAWISRVVFLFFALLARGDDLSQLLCHMRGQLNETSQNLVLNKELSSSPSSSSSSLSSSPLPLSDDKPGKGTSNELKELPRHGGEMQDKISKQDALLLGRAARTALFFSVESGKAEDEVKKLLYEPIVAEAVRQTPLHVKSTSFPLPSKYEYMLSNRAAVSYARKWAREGRWDWGLQLLANVTPTPVTMAAGTELFSQAGQWDMAIHCLSTIPSADWTEVEVSAAIRGLFHASQRRSRTLEKTASKSTKMSATSCDNWKLALHILSLCVKSGVQLSTPSSINDILGMLGVRGQDWVTACNLVDYMILNRNKNESCDTSNSKIHPNVVSIYHMCRILRRQWHLALYYASLMVSKGDIRIADDSEVTERFLRLCVTGNRWAEALTTLQVCLEGNIDNEKIKYGDWITVETFLDVLRMLKESQKGSLASRFLLQTQLSKHFSKDATGKAYNVMLRYSNTAAEAQSWLQMMNSKNIPVENESCEHLLIMHAREGEWSQSLKLLSLLLDDPKRNSLYIPSAKAHDAVQYALERAPLPGPGWEVSLRLFSRMCDLQVPISEVSFQSIVKKCFTHGMDKQAQMLFRFAMRRGVHK